MRQQDSLATILLVSRLASEGTEPLRAAELWALIELVAKPAALLGQAEEDLGRLGVRAEMAARIVVLLDRATAMAFELERLDQAGVATLTPFDDHYPQRFIDRLGTKAPPVLHAAGTLDLLDEPGVGVVGSRDVSPEGAEVAKGSAMWAALRGLTLVSGGARGVDQLAMNAAYETEGSVVGILADSLLRALKSPDVRRAVHEGNTVMCTPYGPDAPFSAGNAMGRNKLVYAQSLLTVVVASDVDKGGTWSGAVEALRGQFGRVAVWCGLGEGPGNKRIEEKGATAFSALHELDGLLNEPERPAAPVAATQPSLF